MDSKIPRSGGSADHGVFADDTYRSYSHWDPDSLQATVERGQEAFAGQLSDQHLEIEESKGLSLLLFRGPGQAAAAQHWLLDWENRCRKADYGEY